MDAIAIAAAHEESDSLFDYCEPTVLVRVLFPEHEFNTPVKQTKACCS